MAQHKRHQTAHILHDAARRESQDIERPRAKFNFEDQTVVNKKTGKIMISPLPPKEL